MDPIQELIEQLQSGQITQEQFMGKFRAMESTSLNTQPDISEIGTDPFSYVPMEGRQVPDRLIQDPFNQRERGYVDDRGRLGSYDTDDFGLSGRDKRQHRRAERRNEREMMPIQGEDRESYIERRQEELAGQGFTEPNYEQLAQEYDQMESQGAGTDPFLNLPMYTGMDLGSRARMSGMAFGAGDIARGVAGAGSTLFGVGREFLGGLSGTQATRRNYQDSNQEMNRLKTRYTNEYGKGVDDTGSWYGQYGGEKVSPVERFNQLFQEGGEMEQMAQMEQEAQMGQMEPQEQPQQQGGVSEEQVLEIAQQLLQEFETIEQMQQYLMEQELPEEFIQVVLETVAAMAQGQPTQEEEMPKSQVMRDTMSGGMDMESMGFRYGGKYPKLR